MTNTSVELNRQQRRAVELCRSSSDPLLIKARAGTGKTRTLAACVAALLDDGVPSDRIALLTFTKTAAEHMIAGTSSSAVATLPWAGTFHSVAFKTVREFGGSTAGTFTVLDKAAAERLLGQLRNAFVRINTSFPSTDDCLAFFSWCRNSRLKIGSALRFFPTYRLHEKALRHLFIRYQKSKRDGGLMDFDDLLVSWLRLLQDPMSRQTVVPFDHIFVDEFQDLNTLQLRILRELTPSGKGLVVVGDNDQAIFDFRSRPNDAMRTISKWHGSSMRQVSLFRNYRSSQTILNLCNRLLTGGKLIRSTISGPMPLLLRPDDGRQQAILVVNELQHSITAGRRFGDHAVLSRRSKDADAVANELDRRGLRFTRQGSTSKREEAHDAVVSALRWLENPKDIHTGLQVIHSVGPVRGARAKIVLAHLSCTDLSAAVGAMPRGLQKRSRALFKVLLRVSKRDRWPREVGLLATAISKGRTCSPEFSSTLVALAQDAKSRSDFLFSHALNSLDRTGSGDDQIVLSTVHSAKGREWAHVSVLSVVDGRFPDEQSKSSSQRESDRRLLYVASSRAKEVLRIYAPYRMPFYERDRAGQPQAKLSLFLTNAGTTMVEIRR